MKNNIFLNANKCSENGAKFAKTLKLPHDIRFLATFYPKRIICLRPKTYFEIFLLLQKNNLKYFFWPKKIIPNIFFGLKKYFKFT